MSPAPNIEQIMQVHDCETEEGLILRWLTRGSGAACGSLPGFMRLLPSY